MPCSCVPERSSPLRSLPLTWHLLIAAAQPFSPLIRKPVANPPLNPRHLSHLPILIDLTSLLLPPTYPCPYLLPLNTGTPPSPLLDVDSDAAVQRRADLQAAGLLLVEFFLAGTAGGAAAEAVEGGEALRRLLFEVFHEDIFEFRAYCEADVSGVG